MDLIRSSRNDSYKVVTEDQIRGRDGFASGEGRYFRVHDGQVHRDEFFNRDKDRLG